MTIQFLIHKVRRLVYLKPEDGGEGSGGGAAVIESAPVADSTPAASTDATPSATDATAEPATMLDALEAHWKSQPRQADGKFAGKDLDQGQDGKPVDQTQAQAADQNQPGQQAQKPTDKPADKPAAEEDLTQMPDGLTPKAQERFQKLANTNRELTQWRQETEPQVNYIRETFQSNGVTKDQFDKAVQFIGAVNRGDIESAQRIIGEEFSALSILAGRPLQSPDPLEQYPDLRQKVDGLQITEADALELARSRRVQAIQTQRFEQANAQQANERQEVQARQSGLNAVDEFCRRMQSSDLDYARIEAHLVPVIPELIQGVPPSRWAAVVEQQYKLIKNVAGSQRQQSQQPAAQVLRPTGSASPAAVPKTAYEAMFGEPDPRNR